MNRDPLNVVSPPKGSKEGYTVHTTCCQYCIVACGYEVHVFDQKDGSAEPPEDVKGLWVSPSMTNKIRVNGKEKIAAVLPDPKCPVNKGNHSVRGGTMGRNLTFSQPEPANEGETTKERLKTPMVRLADGSFIEITPEAAAELVAALIRAATQAEYTLEGGQTKVTFKKPGGLGVKAYGYQFIENLYAMFKLLYQLIGTPNVAEHDRPSKANSSPAFTDAGADPFAFSYEKDLAPSDVIFIIGCNTYENQSVLFMQYMAGKRIICMDPRRHITADYAVKTGGMHLQAKVLGVDSLVLNALAKYIVDQGRFNREFIDAFTAKKANMRTVVTAAAQALPEEGPDKFRKAQNVMTFEVFQQHLMTRKPDGTFLYSIENAAAVSGIKEEDLIRVAEILSDPTKRVSIIYEKGLIWGYNYQNIAAVINLGLLLGSVMRPGAGVTGRAGGHQIGEALPVYDVQKNGKTLRMSYPFHNASDWYDSGDGQPFITHHNFDSHLFGLDVAPVHDHAIVNSPKDINLFWAIGCNPAGQINNSEGKWKRVLERQEVLGDEGKPQPGAGLEEIKQALIRRMQAGGLVMIHQDIYPNYTTEAADIILSAAGWGEEDFSRYNGERRLRIYEGFQDPPAYSFDNAGAPITRCLPDWRIFKMVAQALAKAPAGNISQAVVQEFAWQTSADVFDEAAIKSNRSNLLKAIVDYGRAVIGGGGPVGHRVLKGRGTAGLLLPTRLGQDGSGAPALIETPSIYKTDQATNPFFFVRSNWLDIERDFLSNLPRPGEIWITNGRVNETWNTMFTHIRNEYVKNRFQPGMSGTILEVNPTWARNNGIDNGALVRVTADNIHLGASSGSYLAIASLQESVPEGGAFALFSYPHNEKLQSSRFPFRKFTGQGYNNNITSGYIDPINPIAALKYGRARVERVGTEVFDSALLKPIFAQRNIAYRETKVSNPNDEFERARWRMRELIVTKGLPRLRIERRRTTGEPLGRQPHYDGSFRELFQDPDRFIKFLETEDGRVLLREYLIPTTRPQSGSPSVMHWRDTSGKVIDEWNAEEHAIVTRYYDLLMNRPL